jgi:hypothetical protein
MMAVLCKTFKVAVGALARDMLAPASSELPGHDEQDLAVLMRQLHMYAYHAMERLHLVVRQRPPSRPES